MQIIHTLGYKHRVDQVLDTFSEIMQDVAQSYSDTALPEKIDYLLSSRFTPERVVILFYTKSDETYHFVSNVLKRNSEVQSSYSSNKSISVLIKGMSNGQRKFLNLGTKQFKDKAKLAERDDNNLTPFEITMLVESEEEKASLWRKYIECKKDVMDLTGLYDIHQNFLIQNGPYEHETIIFNSNREIRSVSLVLSAFPKAKIVTIWNMSVSDDMFESIERFSPDLTTLEFHTCPNITGKIFKYIAPLKNISNFILNNENAVFQSNVRDMVITEEEFKSIKNVSLTTVLVDSGNFTRDFMKGLFSSYQSLEHLILNDEVLDDLKKNSASGYEYDKIHFHSVSNTRNGFTLNKTVKLYDLVKDRLGEVFSDSMLKKIKELNPEKTELIDTMLKN